MEQEVRVYFSEIAKIATVRWCVESARILNQLKRDEGLYLCTNARDYNALAPYRVWKA
jgi:hypothetical protein